jgi:hypothetical protein
MQLNHNTDQSFRFRISGRLFEALEYYITFKNPFIMLLVLSCVDIEQFDTSAGNKSRQPLLRPSKHAYPKITVT